MEKVPVEYVILCFQISQGFVDFIHEVAVFDSYEAAKKHWDENPKKYSAEGHAWSGLTEYHIAGLKDGKYLDPLTEKHLMSSAAFGSDPEVKKIARK
jgi:hypothetical protein